MPTKTPAYAATSATAPLGAFSIERRDVGPNDVAIDILFCGVCHSDIHQVRNEWGNAVYPMVPGHEIVGRVTKVGANVKKLAVGDIAGVGCMVGSCGECPACKAGDEQFCLKGNAQTYNSTEMDRKTPTYGGYSTHVVVGEKFTLKVPAGLDPAGAAPLLCAGITTYSPLHEYGCKKGDRVGVVGLGGLGHMAVKLAVSMGAEVTLFSTSASKEEDARRLGASSFVVTKDPANLAKLAGSLDLIIDTVSAAHDYNAYLAMLRSKGTMVLVGAPPQPTPVSAFSLIMGGRRLVGSLIGGIAATQAMLDHCAQHAIVSDIEVIPVQKIDEAYERMLRSDVKYRFVIDLASLK
jgi:uncharacterized zinc-type alcohol dehydrogenase-like protein